MPTPSGSIEVMDRPRGEFTPRIYYLHPLAAGPFATWSRHMDRCREMGFDHLGSGPIFAPGSSGDIFLAGNHETVHPVLRQPEPADSFIRALVEMCHRHGLKLILDLVLDRLAVDAELAKFAGGWFRSADAAEPIRPDPRSVFPRGDTAYARFDDPKTAKELATWWIGRLARLTQAGVAGFRCKGLQAVPRSSWQDIIEAVRRVSSECHFLAWTPGLNWPDVSNLRGLGFDGVFSSVAWWDGRKSWLVEENELLRQVGSVIACPEAPFGMRLARRGTDDPNGL
jgi:starch synthase (maltosyl-transferring)